MTGGGCESKVFFFLMKGQAFINANRKNRRLGGGGGVA